MNERINYVFWFSNFHFRDLRQSIFKCDVGRAVSGFLVTVFLMACGKTTTSIRKWESNVHFFLLLVSCCLSKWLNQINQLINLINCFYSTSQSSVRSVEIIHVVSSYTSIRDLSNKSKRFKIFLIQLKMLEELPAKYERNRSFSCVEFRWT